jgi:hypothetical protein
MDAGRSAQLQLAATVQRDGHGVVSSGDSAAVAQLQVSVFDVDVARDLHTGRLQHLGASAPDIWGWS